MTIQDVLQTGKKFFRKSDDSMYYPGPGFYYLTKEDILATDWEVEVIKKELSAEDIRLAFGYLDESGQLPNMSLLQLSNLEKNLIKFLGLE